MYPRTVIVAPSVLESRDEGGVELYAMKQIHATRTLADAYILRDVLQREGVPATIRNEHLPGAAGEVPVAEEMPAVCVADGDVARARFILDEYLRDDDAAAALDEMDSEATPDAEGSDAQVSMMELFLAATRLVRRPGHGESVDQLVHHGAFVETTAAPFGIPAKTWSVVGRLAAAAVDAAIASDENEVQARATQLRDALRPFV